eukprot:TRINITY_DN2294_c0_g1_i2.p1 TRINITY_DN2294_c0_g1~~TRINITY_DN2294_c0_g1_i2.p1  ORF type:complete len:654 (-),score=171.81 TRINITY_DN2294_c0_g1_i2:1-1962(-)
MSLESSSMSEQVSEHIFAESRDEVAARRLNRTLQHLSPAEGPQSELPLSSVPCAASSSAPTASSLSWAKNLDNLKWNGWGYKDSGFLMNDKGQVYFAGKRYELAGSVLPHFRGWAEKVAGVDPTKMSPPQQPEDILRHVASPIKNEAFLRTINGQYAEISFDASERLFHAHGHTCQEIYKLRWGKFGRVPDVVIWPASSDHVEAIVAAANAHNVVIIPYGGGTSVTDALEPPVDETRMIVSLPTKRMNKIRVDIENMTAFIEAGAVGVDIERELSKYGMTLGHEPDSHEFSSMGGWVATRASGMRKNVYGNIEDILLSATIVTPTGTISRPCHAPRISTGPDVNEFILGSEGMLGVITDATVKIKPLPEAHVYGSIVFPTFEAGVQFMKELSRRRAAPASVRLVDNEQFIFAQALKPGVSTFRQMLDAVKKWYVTGYKGYAVNDMCAATLLFEGTKEQVDAEQKLVYKIAHTYGGLVGGPENGKRGYLLTFLIAYLRDYGFDHFFVSESFETSVKAKDVLQVCVRVKERIRKAAAARGIVHPPPFVSSRVTQIYDTGFAVYFYFGFVFAGVKDPLEAFSQIEVEARDEILKLGGSLSHHHGVGKLRAYAMEDAIGKAGVDMLQGLKRSIDPKNVFGARNMGLGAPPGASLHHH